MIIYSEFYIKMWNNQVIFPPECTFSNKLIIPGNSLNTGSGKLRPLVDRTINSFLIIKTMKKRLSKNFSMTDIISIWHLTIEGQGCKRNHPRSDFLSPMGDSPFPFFAYLLLNPTQKGAENLRNSYPSRGLVHPWWRFQ